MKCLYRQWQKPRRPRLRSAAPVAWCRRRSPWIPQPCPWMSADASWTCFARETGLESNTQGSLSTKRSQSITLDSGSFPVIIVSTFRSMQSGNLLINANTAPRCLVFRVHPTHACNYTKAFSSEKETHCWVLTHTFLHSTVRSTLALIHLALYHKIGFLLRILSYNTPRICQYWFINMVRNRDTSFHARTLRFQGNQD